MLLSILEFCCSVLHKIHKGFLILLLTVFLCIDVGLCLFLFFTGGPGRGGLHHEWQPAAAEEEQEEVEAAVVPPQRQGALHLHSP